MTWTDLSDKTCDDVVFELYWMSLDRTAEFQQVLHVPIRDLKVVQRHMADWIASQRAIPAEADVQTVHDLSRATLAHLEQAGEDVDAIYHYALSFGGSMIPSHGPEAVHGNHISMFMTWEKALSGWSPKRLAALERPGPDLRDELFAGYMARVAEPAGALSDMADADAKAWLGDRGRRTEHDQLLHEFYFGEVGIDPSAFFVPGYRKMLAREWWRPISATITPDQKAQLMTWMEETARAADVDGFLTPDDFGWLDDALTLASVPPLPPFAQAGV